MERVVRAAFVFVVVSTLGAQEPETNTDRCRALVASGQVHALAREWAVAIEDLTSALALVPDDFEARRWRGHAFTGATRYAEALTDLEHALAIDEGDAWTNDARGMALHHLGRIAQAIDSYSRCLAIDAGFVKAYEWRGYNRSLLGDQVHAIADLDQVIAHGSDNPWVRFIRGKAYVALLDFDRAAADLWLAVDAEPGNADFHAQLGYLEACAGHDDAARRLLELMPRVLLARNRAQPSAIPAH